MSMTDPFLQTIFPLVLLFGIFYFLLIRPQQQRVKAHQKMVEAVKRGDTVVTSGGIVGKVAKVKDDGELLVEVAENVQLRILKGTLTEVRPKDGKAE